MPPLIDIVFVHGLGGSRRDTWTYSDSNTTSFWPPWLYEKSDLKNVRISTFGYDANWTNVTAPGNKLAIGDFALQLLDELDLHYDAHGDVPPVALSIY